MRNIGNYLTTMNIKALIKQDCVIEIIEYAKSKIKELTGIEVDLKPKIISSYESSYSAKLSEIVEAVTGISFDKINSKGKQIKISTARHIFVYVYHTYIDDNISALGRLINRDRTTIMHSISVIKNWIDTNDKFLPILNDVVSQFESTIKRVA
jgi:chromosomal replication initiation ATPase DnaA